ncbi:MAG: c-type cytochrome [Acidiferrobacterales bacterium]|nr:c-type cytochrome [Acidiferrobacterales bacterium]
MNSRIKAFIVIANRLLLVIVAGCVLSACSNSDAELEAQLLAGQELAKKHCVVCHAQGINGAPIIGNTKMWGPRIEKGREALVLNALNGNGLMPAKGGNENITKEQIDLVVGYYLAELEKQ